MKIWLAALLLVSLFFTSSFLQTAMAGPSNPPPVAGFCDSKCKVRCSKASIWDGCYKYCTLCCSECKCVPSGTYGHKDECPCYRDKMSSKGTPKCP